MSGVGGRGKKIKHFRFSHSFIPMFTECLLNTVIFSSDKHCLFFKSNGRLLNTGKKAVAKRM